MNKNDAGDSSISYTPSEGKDSAEKPVVRIKKQIFFMPGIKISIFGAGDRLMAKAYGLPFRLKEKIKIYSDDAMQHQILTSSTKKILDWNVVFQLTQLEGKKIGSLRRKGWSSEFVRDSWVIFDKNEQQVAELLEDSAKRGLIRRFLVGFLPQTYYLKTKEGRVLTLKQSWNPLLLRYSGYCTEWSKLVKELSEPLLVGVLSTITIIESRQ